MRLVKARLGKAGGVGRDQRQAARIGEIDQPILGPRLSRIVAAADLDIEPVGKQLFQRRAIVCGCARLILGIEPRQRPLPARREAEQIVGPPGERLEADMGLLLDRPVKMRHRDKRAEIVVAAHGLRIERQPVIHRRRTRRAAGPRDT
jgi:hypothetical protein